MLYSVQLALRTKTNCILFGELWHYSRTSSNRHSFESHQCKIRKHPNRIGWFPSTGVVYGGKMPISFLVVKKNHVSANLQALLLLIANANGPFLFCTSITQSAGRREELKKQTNTRNEYIATPAMHNQSHHVHKYD